MLVGRRERPALRGHALCRDLEAPAPWPRSENTMHPIDLLLPLALLLPATTAQSLATARREGRACTLWLDIAIDEWGILSLQRRGVFVATVEPQHVGVALFFAGRTRANAARRAEPAPRAAFRATLGVDYWWDVGATKPILSQAPAPC